MIGRAGGRAQMPFREAVMTQELNLSGRKLVQVALTCRDLDRSRAFYRDTLGLPLLFEVSNMMFFQLENLRLMVGKEMKPDAPIGGSLIYFDAPDMDAIGAALDRKSTRLNSSHVSESRMPS